MNNKKGLTITMIFKAQSLNFGEGIGNISELKKITRGNGNTYTYISRQALRYDIVRMANKMYNWNLDVVSKEGSSPIQFCKTIMESQEMDLFGYMKTIKGKNSETRSAAVRISDGISLEKYKGDMDFLNNKGLADRQNVFPDLANIEKHESYYTYTITIDLDKIGMDNEIELEMSEKQKRVKELLEVIKVLNREIKGREENLSPLFVIGGIYKINSPFFQGRINLEKNNSELGINIASLIDTMNLTIDGEEICKDTKIGITSGEFENESKIREEFKDDVVTVEEFFKNLEEQVTEYYI